MPDTFKLDLVFDYLHPAHREVLREAIIKATWDALHEWGYNELDVFCTTNFAEPE